MQRFDLDLKRLTLMGGGSGPSALIPGLAEILPGDTDITIVVGTHDGGSSSGKLRRIFGGPAVGDVRKNLSAACGDELSDIFEMRFGAGAKKRNVDVLNTRLLALLVARGVEAQELNEIRNKIREACQVLSDQPAAKFGQLGGHVYGNLVLTAMRMLCGGDLVMAAKKLHGWLDPMALVLPITGMEHDLVMDDWYTEIWGEGVIDEHRIYDPYAARVWLDPEPGVAPDAFAAIAEATAVMIGPGSVFTSLMPLLFVNGVREALREQGRKGGKLIYVANLIEEPHATHGLTAADQLNMMQARIGRPFDLIVHNRHTGGLPKGTSPQLLGKADIPAGTLVVGADLLDERRCAVDPNDAIAHLRSSVHHDGLKLGRLLREYMPVPSLIASR